MKKIFLILTLLLLNLTTSVNAATNANSQAKIYVKNYGVITVELNAHKAPASVANFIKYINSGFYTNTLFHRVIDGFMIQGGGLDLNGQKKTTLEPIKNEANNGLKNIKYSIAMARTAEPNSATSQFFINVSDNSFLNYTAATNSGYGYAVFGQVIAGQDVVDKIKRVATKAGDVPSTPIIIEKVELVK